MSTLEEVLSECNYELPDFYDSKDYDPEEDFPDEDSYFHLCQMEDDDQ